MSRKLNLTHRELHKTVEEVEANLHKRFGFSVDRQKEFEKLYSLCLKIENKKR